MNNTNGEEYKSAVKKAVSSLNQALTLHYALEGLTADDYSSPEEIVNNIFKKRMNVLEIKNNPYKSDYKIYICEFLDKRCKYYSPKTSTSFITQDGTLFYMPTEYLIGIDVNGSKGPNKPTTSSSNPKDQYTVLLYNNSIFIQAGPLDEIMRGGSKSKWNVSFWNGENVS